MREAGEEMGTFTDGAEKKDLPDSTFFLGMMPRRRFADSGYATRRHRRHGCSCPPQRLIYQLCNTLNCVTMPTPQHSTADNIYRCC